MTTVIKFPRLKRYPQTVSGKEVWAQEEPPTKMVWEVCHYTNSNNECCAHCPQWEDDPDYGKVQRGCYTRAAEACRIVFAMQNREAK